MMRYGLVMLGVPNVLAVVHNVLTGGQSPTTLFLVVLCGIWLGGVVSALYGVMHGPV